ncbi:MAG: tRNA uridine-5-carboxymethylaminomethyl(34) synthesis enzyme MnmG [Ruminococcaceae bacterium]|nr:tRNA uridine-5-carboxymethylaminomethyl(34) synthesis enzyme MnmG [Oscillospiraceae bacterium]
MDRENYFDAGECDVAVVGAGHAGCEAALACARMGFKTIIFAINLDSVGNMPCNPSIGGTSKGQLVREIDALGGSMGKIADKTTLQSKILNRAKGPAVYSLRAQIDRRDYQVEMKHELELEKNLEVKQGEIIDILTEDGENIPFVTGVVTHTGATYKCKSVILSTGTYLKGRVIIGDVSYSSGPDGLFPANSLSARLKELGFTLKRFKTGTPARIRREGIDFSQMEIQYGDDVIEPFSAETEKVEIDQMPCYLTHTTAETHEIIRQNIHRSPMFNGSIEGVGPRYCPSIEDKVMRFADKERHQAFVEPMGRNTEEMYLQGMSSSLPEDVQIKFIRSIKGLSDVVIMRPAYAIEYDAIDAQQLKLSLESRIVDNLFCAGQINGSSGYEEAAAQGIVAGINAALKLQGREPLIIDRSEGYTGVLIDDLVTMGTNEPYRMMTSRAEYRLVLRHDNAEERLLEKGYNVGLISEERYQKFLKKQNAIKTERERLENTYISHPKTINSFLEEKGSTPLKCSVSLADLLRRPEIVYADIKEIEKLAEIESVEPVSKEVGDELEILVKYEGYIKRQEQQINQFRKMEKKLLPADFDYKTINTLSLEAREKLNKIKPASIGQASRISGVSPADITALLVYFKEV